MNLFLTPASISFLAETLIFLIITIYLVILKSRSVANYWLAGFYAVMVTASLAGFFGVSILFWYSNAIYIHDAMVVTALPLLIQFAYNFPVINPQRKRQSKVVLTISIIVIILTIISVLIKILNPAFITLPEISTLILSIIQLLGILFTLFIFLDLSKQISKSSNTRNWFKQLLNPDNRISFAIRGFIIVLICLFLIWTNGLVLRILNNDSIAFFVSTLGTAWAFTILVITLVNQTKQKESFFIKFFGIILLTVFTGISASSWLAAPTNLANFQASYAIPNSQTIHFEQNNATYAITQKSCSFEENSGKKVQFSEGQTTTMIDPLFSFPFAGENWDQFVVSQKGFVLFYNSQQNLNKLTLPHNPNPVIAALYIEELTPSKDNGVFINLSDEKSIITWYFRSISENNNDNVTAQLTLYPDGSFDISYNGIRANFKYNPYIPIELHQVTGFFLGANDYTPYRIQFNGQLPFISENWSGVYQDYYIDFRSFLHQHILTQLFSMVLILLVVIIVFPIFLQNSLIIPLRTLRKGINQISKGETEVQIESHFNDEFGQTTNEFNQMALILANKKIESDDHITDLEDRLYRRTNELKLSIEKLSSEISLRKSLKEKLDKCNSEFKKLAVMDDMVNCFNRAHFIDICEEELKRAKRYETTLSLMLIDPDYLRMINETYGTLTGNEILKLMVENISTKLRETDTLGRIGGEEFAIIMPQTNGQDALIAANRIRNIIGQNSLETSKGPIRISASIGVVEMPAEGVLSLDVLLNRASLARDFAKTRGRNQSVIWSADMEKNSMSDNNQQSE